MLYSTLIELDKINDTLSKMSSRLSKKNDKVGEPTFFDFLAEDKIKALEAENTNLISQNYTYQEVLRNVKICIAEIIDDLKKIDTSK